MNDYEVQEERRRTILRWLSRRGSIAVAELVRQFAVSRMTIHRDLDYLADQGAVQKWHGWVELPEAPLDDQHPQGSCDVCQSSLHYSTLWTLELCNGQRRQACCPCCGITLFLQSTEVKTIQAREFLHGRVVDGRRASYVAGSRVNPCCRPGLLAFGKPQDAADFQRGFGGRVLSFPEALATLEPGLGSRGPLRRDVGGTAQRAHGLALETIGAFASNGSVTTNAPVRR